MPFGELGFVAEDLERRRVDATPEEEQQILGPPPGGGGALAVFVGDRAAVGVAVDHPLAVDVGAVDVEGAFVGVYNSAFKTGYLLAPTLSMALLAFTGFDGSLDIQSEETKNLLQACLFGGCAVTFVGAFVLSLGVRLTRAEVEAAQRQKEDERNRAADSGVQLA